MARSRGRRGRSGGGGFRVGGFNLFSMKFIVPLVLGMVIVVLSPSLYIKVLGWLKPSTGVSS